jgi:hypothetical protein
MTNVKCIRCGGLNVDTAQICKICQIELNPVRPPFAQPASILLNQPHPNTAAPTPASLIRPFNEIGDILGPTFNLFSKNFWLITKIVVVIVAPFEIFRALNLAGLENNGQLSSTIFVLDSLCKVLIAPALIYALMQVMETGTAPGVNEAYRWGLGKVGKLTVCAALAFIFQMLGFALCFIPGIIVYFSLFLVFPIAILEKGSITGALQSSSDATKGHRANICVAWLVLWLLTLLFSLPEWGLKDLSTRSGGLRLLYAATAIFSDIFEQSTTVLSLVTYLSIRALWSQRTQ